MDGANDSAATTTTTTTTTTCSCKPDFILHTLLFLTIVALVRLASTPSGMGSSYVDLSSTLVDAFSALADEVQALSDRRTILEHKLRFAHEQFQYLADKYAPTTPEIAETLAKLQLPPNPSIDESSTVPLRPRNTLQSQHQLALLIRDGRRVAAQLSGLGEASKTTGSTRETFSRTSDAETSPSTALEHDFTVEGKRGNLQCPFSKQQASREDHEEEIQGEEQQDHTGDPTPHHSNDPICAAMFEDTASQQAAASASGAGKCPIRFMDKHSPEEIARYVETHKHELPRSHEICVRRYQRNEDQIKKLDSKYGNLVSMIEGLSHLHQPMLPEAEQGSHEERKSGDSNERVENWAQTVTVSSDPEAHEEDESKSEDDGRESHFDRPLKEVRVGESPSRPWGIHVPVFEPSGQDDAHPLSPPPAPVRMPSPKGDGEVPTRNKGPGKCPFDHTQLAALMGTTPLAPKPDAQMPVTPERRPSSKEPLFSPAEKTTQPTSPPALQPAFIDPETLKSQGGQVPQMVFTGPVFIGYPMEQAIQFMNQYRPNQ